MIKADIHSNQRQPLETNITDGVDLNQGQRAVTQPWGDAERTVRQRRIAKRLKTLTPQTIVHHSQKLVHRTNTWRQKRAIPHPATVPCPVFIVGSNRSGTHMVCEAIGQSPHAWDYPESELSLAYKGFHLRSDWLIERLIRYAPTPILSFGCPLDSQDVSQLLARFEGARATWVYRRYEDAVNSSIHKWNSNQKDLVRWVARGEPERLGARGRNISVETTQVIKELFHEELSAADGACLYWYMRNQIYFDQMLHDNPRVLIVQYEDTVFNPERAFRRIFDFLRFPYDPVVTSRIFSSSVGKQVGPTIDPIIRKLCDSHLERLDAHYAATSGWTPATSA